MNGIDLFAGGGGTSTGAKMAGINMIWAANHNTTAVDYHKINHPDMIHECQDLHQCQWENLPDYDIGFASPCCQGHSKASGKLKGTARADVSRSTAWAVVSAAETNKAPVYIIENVADFLDWALYPAWEFAMKSLGYALSVNIVDGRELEVPQSRIRMFIIATKSANPIELKLPKFDHIPARSIIDFNDAKRKWSHVSTRVPKTQMRVRNGQKRFGDVFLDAAYGSAINGRSINKPLGTVKTVNVHSLVIGDMIGSLSVKELAAAQTFPADYIWPKSSVAAKMMIGNAVPPKMAMHVTKAVLAAL